MPSAVRRTARALGAAAAAAALVSGLAGCNGSSGGTHTAEALHGQSATVPLHVVSADNATLALARVTIDGKGPFTFAVDTGASTSLVDSTVAKQLGLATHGSSTVNGVSCSTSVSHAVLSQWSVGSLTLPKTTVAVANLPGKQRQGGLQGLLGSDVLRQFGAVTIDYDAGQLAVGKAARQPGATASVPLTVATSKTGATLALVSVRLRGHGPYRFAVDTGAATTTVATATAHGAGLHVTKAPGTVRGVACITQHSQAGLTQWRMGSLPLPATTVDVVDMAHGQGMPALQGLLGSNVLADFGRVTVDYGGQRLVVPARKATSPSVSATGTSMSVPLQVQRSAGNVLVFAKVRIGGHGPYTFAVDTGAPESVVTTSVAKAVGLQRIGPSHAVHGVSGTSSGYPAQVTRWSAGSVHLPAATVVVTDLPVRQVDGLIGADVLAHYGTVGLDYTDQVLRLGSAVQRPAHQRTVQMDVSAGVAGVRALVPVTVSGHQQAFALDTGASQSAIDSGLARQLGLPTVGHETDAGVTKKGTSPVARVSHWSLGSVALPPGSVLVLPLQHQNIAAGLLGSDVLSGFGTVVIDFGKGQLVLPASS